MVLKSLTFYLGVDQEKKRAGRPPKVSDLQLCALFILSYITNTPVFTLAKCRWKEFRAGRDQKGFSISLASSEGSPPLPYSWKGLTKRPFSSEAIVGGRGVG